MDGIISIFSQFQGYIILGLIIVMVILLITVIVLLRAVSTLENKYRKFMRGSNSKNLEELILNYKDNVEQIKEDNVKIKDNISDISKKVKVCIQKTSMLRYRAFEDVGSDLSYSIALLDDNNDGVLITGIYGRHESTTYAKPIDKGISRYDLSEEEKYVIEQAMNKKEN